jgi:hypothetical protein
MNTQPCPQCTAAEGTETALPLAIASRIESLRQERVRAFAEQAFHVGGRNENQTPLERGVDDLLDSLSVLHRLEQLAALQAHGGHITVDADRVLIAENEDTYRTLLSRFMSSKSTSLLAATFLPSQPVPLD